MNSFLRRAFVRASRWLPLRALRTGVRELQQELDRRSDHWITVHQRPKTTDHVRRIEMAATVDSVPATFAVVMQGPLLEKDDFTLNTVQLYRRQFPGASVIVSTWVGSNAGLLERLQAAGAEIVLSDPPTVAGVSNVNYQIISTRAGIERAVTLGAEFVLKSRSDQRVHAPGLGVALPALLAAFPSRAGSGQGARIVTGSNDSRLFIPYHLADQLQCGAAIDMLAFWSAPLDIRPREIDWTLPIRDLVTSRNMAEVYLTTHYLERLGVETPCRLESWWDALARYFCVIDSAAFDWYWPKHDHQTEYRYRCYSAVVNSEIMTFVDWLQLLSHRYPSLNNRDAVLGLRIGDTIPSGWFEEPARDTLSVPAPCGTNAARDQPTPQSHTC